MADRPKSVGDVLKMMKDKEVKFLDLRFTDTKGKMQHVTADGSCVNEAMFAEGYAFDGFGVLAAEQSGPRRDYGPSVTKRLANVVSVSGAAPLLETRTRRCPRGIPERAGSRAPGERLECVARGLGAGVVGEQNLGGSVRQGVGREGRRA